MSQPNVKSQFEIEKQGASLIGRPMRDGLTLEQVFGPVENWLLQLGPYHLLYMPIHDRWLYWDWVHEAWQDTGHKAFEVEFYLEGDQVLTRPAHAPGVPAQDLAQQTFAQHITPPANEIPAAVEVTAVSHAAPSLPVPASLSVEPVPAVVPVEPAPVEQAVSPFEKVEPAAGVITEVNEKVPAAIEPEHVSPFADDFAAAVPRMVESTTPEGPFVASEFNPALSAEPEELVQEIEPVTESVDIPSPVFPWPEPPVIAQPFEEEPLIPEAAAIEPVVEPPMVDFPVAEEPVVELPAVEISAAEKLAAIEPAWDLPAVEIPAVGEVVVEMPVIEELAADEMPLVIEPPAEIPSVPLPEPPVLTPSQPESVISAFPDQPLPLAPPGLPSQEVAAPQPAAPLPAASMPAVEKTPAERAAMDDAVTPRPQRKADEFATTMLYQRPVIWELKVIEGVAAGVVYRLKPLTTIGRASDNVISLDDPMSSRHHARLEWAGAMYIVVDLGSSNGTFVNDEKISKPAPLEEGSRLKIGQTLFEVQKREG